MDATTFEAALTAWLTKAQAIITENYTRAFPNLRVPVLSLQVGKRYIRVVRDTSVHCFIDTTNGDVLKAASWKGPAKGARGNIFTGELGVSSYGGLYNR